MTIISGLSGNEIACLHEKGYSPGNIVVGNSVYSLGVLRSIGSGLKALLGGELEAFTHLIEEGREVAYKRMVHEAQVRGGVGITSVNSELIFHGGNIEFLSMGSTLHEGKSTGEKLKFSTCADGQELYAQLDAGYTPICFAFGNVAYSMGVSRGIIGSLRSLARGEVVEFSNIFNHTRHLALERITKHAEQNNANAVVGIKTTIIPFSGVKEMLMIGTASVHPQLNGVSKQKVVTSDLTNQEMWNLAKIGYAPIRLVLGTSVYSLGVIGGITSLFKSFIRGEISELTQLIYSARENALGIMRDEARNFGAEDVVGVKTYVYNLGGGLIEFLAIGTAVKKVPGIKTQSESLLAQAIIHDRDTFINMADTSFGVDLNAGGKG